MKVIESEMIVMWDVDGTLILPVNDKTLVKILSPYSNKIIEASVHQEHVRILKEHKARGYTNIVWSAAGYKWAEAVIKELRIEEYVDLILTKPTKHFDDLPTSEIMGQRVYITP